MQDYRGLCQLTIAVLRTFFFHFHVRASAVAPARYIAPSPPPVIPMHAKRYSMELSDGHTAERQWTAGDNNPKANALPGPPMLKRQVPPPTSLRPRAADPLSKYL